MPDKVRCVDCGYLAIRVDLEIIELPSEIRNTVTGDKKFCFVRQKQFDDDMQRECANGNPHDAALRFTTASRACDGFTEWKLGFSPKEHCEMRFSNEMLLMQQEFQAQQSALADSRHRDSMRVAIVGAGLGAFATLLAGSLAVWATLRTQSDAVSTPPTSIVSPATK